MLKLDDTRDVCEFRVGGHSFAIDSEGVAEVLHSAALTPVPLAPEAIVGLLHLRGRIVPVIDMRRRLELSAAPGAAAPAHLVVRRAEDWYSLLVDEVLDVHAIPRAGIEPHASSVGDAAADAVTGVFACPDRLIHILDPERVVQAIHRQRTPPLVRHGVTHGR